MPAKRAKGARPTRQSARRRAAVEDDIPDVYGDMLAEAAAEEASTHARSSKRRKLDGQETRQTIDLDIDLFGEPSTGTGDFGDGAESADVGLPKIQQLVFDDFEGSDDDDSDAEFEDVDLDAAPAAADDPVEDATSTEQKPLELDLSSAGVSAATRRAQQRRKPVGPAERKLRLETHKAHLILLLAHLTCRNRWCESEQVHALLKPLVPRKVVSLLHVDEAEPQYRRSHSFTKGIEEICALWKVQWRTTARGMRRAYWRDSPESIVEEDDDTDEDLITFDDFKAAAAARSGSRDLGAQLFCALLRSVAVDARLVCSLQVLPFSGVAKGQTPEKAKAPRHQYIHAPPQNYNTNTKNGRSSASTPRKKKIVESPFPIFWVEVFSPSTVSWISLDPIVRNTINKPKTGFEPPASDQLNSMAYVVAFEDDGSCRDVTQRYTQWYNAKTRRQRVESTKAGQEWWRRTMAVLRKPFTEVRDEIEDAALLKRAENEAMPRNVQDFRGHPVYVLERHLRMNEVIHPKHEVGKVSAGLGGKRLESVFRRHDVHLCRSADAWYRRGRDVAVGEQPLKRVVPKRGKPVNHPEEDEEDEEGEGVPLYAEYQTNPYEPPPVVDHKIPRNAYGNLDVYVPTMIPAGAVHVRHPLAAEAARALGVDHADAVTGFEFKGRQGTAVVDGVVVSADMSDALVDVIEGLEEQATEEVEEARSKLILGLWKRWLTALRVREHVQTQYGEREDDDREDDDREDDDETYIEDRGGGFMLEEATPPPDEADTSGVAQMPPPLRGSKPLGDLLPPEIVRQPIIIVKSPNSLPPPPLPEPPTVVTAGKEALLPGGTVDDVEGGGFVLDDHDMSVERPNNPSQEATSQPAQTDGGGGFLVEDEDNLRDTADPSSRAGGFVPEAVGEEVAHHDPPDVADGVTAPGGDTEADPPPPKGPPTTGRSSLPSGPGSPASSTSLLSHDPDEEDAEPEWLLNSLGELD